MTPQTLGETLSLQYGYTSNTFPANLKDLTDEDGLKQPGTDGNCLNWVAGHVVKYRLATLGLLGQEAPFSAEKYDRYQRMSDPVTDGEDTVPLTQMVGDFAATKDALFFGLKNLDPVAMDQPAPYSPSGNPNETIGSLIAGLLFHESYHIGQLGILRRLAGSEGAIR